MAKVLLLEDNLELAQMVKDSLRNERYAVDVVHRIADAREYLVAYEYDVVIMDLHLPDGDGVELCQEFRRRDATTPVLMLTTRDTVDEKISGLDSGSDDYLTKPFEMTELLARLRALLRRGHDDDVQVIELGDLQLDLLSRSASVSSVDLQLAPREFDLLAFLLKNPKEEFDVEALRIRVWGVLSEVSRNAIMTAISRLRSKLQARNARVSIETGINGYRLVHH